MDDDQKTHPETGPLAWSRKTIGSVFFCDIGFPQLWEAVVLSETPEQLDVAIKTLEDLNQIVYDSRRKDSPDEGN